MISVAKVFEVAAALFAVVAAVFWSLFAFGELPQMMPVADPEFAVNGLALMTSWAAGLTGAAALCAGLRLLL
jgi:hypothetical protein